MVDVSRPATRRCFVSEHHSTHLRADWVAAPVGADIGAC